MSDQGINNRDKQERDMELNVARQNNAIREPDKLTVEEITRAMENGNKFFAQLASQLLYTMRENEQLKNALSIIRQNTFDIGDSADKEKFLYNIANEALSNKQSAHNWDQEMYEQMLPDSLKSTKTSD